LVRAAAEGLGVAAEAAEPATAAGLLDDGTRLRFRDPLVRSVVYWTATPADRQLVHAALAEATDREIDPDRRAWHRAQAAPGPDEAVAAELERSASRAQRRGGLAAAAAFLQRAVELTRDTNRRSERALSASQASLHAGAFDAALTVLAATDAGRLNEVQRVSADLLRGQVAFASTVGSDAPPLLLKAAKRLESIDLDHARETYLEAWGAALFAGGFATTGSLLEVSQAARLLPPPSHPPGPSDLLLDGLTLLVTEGRAAAAGTLRKATRAFVAGDISSEQNVRWGWLTTVPSHVLWDDESWQVINVHQVQFARDAGALARLPIDLTASAILEAWSGNFTGAAEAIAEAEVVTEATATKMAPYAAMLLAALRGREDQSSVIANALRDATAGGQGMGVQFANLVSAILFNGLGRYEEAQIAASRASEESPELYLSAWALPELIEASVRSGRAEEAAEALERLTEATVPSSTHWALGIHARARAVVSNGELAEDSYLEAIDHLAQTRLRIELARAHLLYGEWLRRENRRVDARQQLYAAHEMFSAIGVEAFTERARRELITTGETVRKRTFETLDELTPQEAAIARLATDGRTNAEIAAHLFLSPRTVEWHLGKVFRKLGVASRRDLALGSDQRSRGSRSEHQYRGAVFVP
jgi:DNA-binding NarL/FixJ family response regulator